MLDDDRGAVAALDRVLGDDLAGRAAADHHHVVGVGIPGEVGGGTRGVGSHVVTVSATADGVTGPDQPAGGRCRSICACASAISRTTVAPIRTSARLGAPVPAAFTRSVAAAE